MKFVKKKEVTMLALYSLCSIVIVACTLMMPISAAVAYNAFWAPVWMSVTHSGGPIGIAIVLLIFTMLVGLQYKTIRHRIQNGIIVLLLLLFTIGGTAFFNEFVIKERLKEFRPSILYLAEHAGLNADEFYSERDKTLRSKYLKSHLNLGDDETVYLDNKPLNRAVLKEWISSTGYSFPSGHSVTAFLLVTLLGYYALLCKRRWIVGILFSWAILIAYSRVLIGVHSSLDVTLGAFWGSVVGFALIYSGLLNRLWRSAIEKRE